MKVPQSSFRPFKESVRVNATSAVGWVQLCFTGARVASRRNGMNRVIPNLILTLLLLPACNRIPDPASDKETLDTLQHETKPQRTAAANEFVEDRKKMVAADLIKRDINNQRVLEVMQRVPRHRFVPPDLRNRAYDDRALPIGEGQTISQPYIVALMTQLVDPQPDDKALDIGTGSGYQAAVLAELVKDVVSIEIVESLATKARAKLKALQYDNVRVHRGDGYEGWESESPFDVIIVAAAPDHIPQALIDQLAPGGKLVIPVGEYYQSLKVIEKKLDGTVTKRDVIPVMFVPMTGKAEKRD